MLENRKQQNLRKVVCGVVCFIVCLVTQTGLLAEDDSEQSILANRYIFQSEKSTIVQTGGIAGVHYTYNVSGQFVLKIDSEAGRASFIEVNANAVEVSPGNHTLDPNKAFVMTSLNGVVLNETTIEFTGKDLELLNQPRSASNWNDLRRRIYDLMFRSLLIRHDSEKWSQPGV